MHGAIASPAAVETEVGWRVFTIGVRFHFIEAAINKPLLVTDHRIQNIMQ